VATERKKRGPIMILLTALLLEAALVFLLVPKESIIEMREREAGKVQTYLGEQSQNEIKETADSWYRTTLVDTGMMEGVYNFLFDGWKDDDTGFDDRGLSALVEQRVDVFWLALHQAYYRSSVIFAWLPCLAPLLFASFFDGLIQRKVRQWQFSYSSPAAHRISSKVLYGVLAVAVLSPFFPLALHPFAMPFMMGACGIALAFGAANIQKRI